MLLCTVKFSAHQNGSEKSGYTGVSWLQNAISSLFLLWYTETNKRILLQVPALLLSFMKAQ